MTLRPVSARWFELLTVPQHLPAAMECLARTGAVELEATSHPTGQVVLPELEPQLRSHRELAHRYGRYWPPAVTTPDRWAQPLGDMLQSAHGRILSWAREADPVIAAAEQLREETADLERTQAALSSAPRKLPDIRLLSSSGPKLQARLFELPAGATLREVPTLVLAMPWQTQTARYLLVVGRTRDIAEVAERLSGLKARGLPLPSWLPSKTADAEAMIASRLSEIARQHADLVARLAALSDRMEIGKGLGDIVLIEWLQANAEDLRGSERLAWITGWTIDSSGLTLRRALDAMNLHYLLRLSEPPAGMNAPAVLRNPAWVKPFEFFTRMLGIPGRDESDPSAIVAVIASSIFGFMFGDVGQGAVVLAAGLLLQRHLPLIRMLVPGGLIAMLFGLMFGSLFCRDDIIPAFWMRPLADPITILVVGVIAGFAIMAIGLLLAAIEAHWRGDAIQWWGQQAGLVVAYVGLAASPVWPRCLWAAVVGCCWYVIGAAFLAVDKKAAAAAAAAAAASFVRHGLELLVNTLSFARIGAFALAHAGLSLAIAEIATASGAVGYWIVLVIGNALVILLEGAVVSIQTTRLLLFEFFIRFLTGAGREFKPLPPPLVAMKNLPDPSLRSTS
jgi:V/A-type H+/Na+-transporting ATPase subunit I